MHFIGLLQDDFWDQLCVSDEARGQIRPAILQNPGMDTFRPTEPLSPGKDTLILLWPSKLVKINLQFQAYQLTHN